MRTLLIASTALVLAACSDNPQPTSPRSIGSATSGAGNLVPAAQNSAKPTDQVGFTKAVVVTGPKVITAGWSGQAIANCPSGTVLVGGGYQYTPPPGGTWPVVTASVPHILGSTFDGWAALVNNTQAGAVDVTLVAYAICAS